MALRRITLAMYQDPDAEQDIERWALEHSDMIKWASDWRRVPMRHREFHINDDEVLYAVGIDTRAPFTMAHTKVVERHLLDMYQNIRNRYCANPNDPKPFHKALYFGRLPTGGGIHLMTQLLNLTKSPQL